MSSTGAAFTASTYEAVVDRLHDCHANLQQLLTRMPHAIASVRTSPILGPWSPYLVSIIMQLERIVKDVIDFVFNLFEGILMPITFAVKSAQWKDNVAKPLSGIAAAVDPANLSLPHSLEWKGEARDNYKDRIASQTRGVTSVTAKANGLGDVLTLSSVAGFAAYVAIGAAVASFFAEQIAAFLADLTGIGALAGLPVAGASGVKVVALLVAIVAAVAAITMQLISQINVLRGLDQADGIFPNGTDWPSATS